MGIQSRHVGDDTYHEVVAARDDALAKLAIVEHDLALVSAGNAGLMKDKEKLSEENESLGKAAYTLLEDVRKAEEALNNAANEIIGLKQALAIVSVLHARN